MVWSSFDAVGWGAADGDADGVVAKGSVILGFRYIEIRVMCQEVALFEKGAVLFGVEPVAFHLAG